MSRIRADAAAAILGLKPRGVQAMAARGDLPGAAKIGKVWTFDPDKLRRFVEAQKRMADKPHLYGETPQEVDEFDTSPKERVYVAGYGRYVKIGFTRAAKGVRLETLQTAAPEKITLYKYIVGGRRLDRFLHEKFARYRREGEWFLNRGTLAAWINGGCALPDDFEA